MAMNRPSIGISLGLAGLRVAQLQALDLRSRRGPPRRPVFGWTSILGCGERPVDHDLAGPERVAAVEEVDLRREAGQVGRLLEGRVAAADDRDLAVLEEEPVARRAGRHAAAAQPGLAVEPEPQRRRPGRDDDRLGAVLRAARPDPERALREVDAVDVDIDEARARSAPPGPASRPSGRGPGCRPGSPGSSRRRSSASAGRPAPTRRGRRARGWPARRRWRRSARPVRSR